MTENMQRLLYALLLGLWASPALLGQQLVPLANNLQLEQYRAAQGELPPPALERNNTAARGRECDLEDPDIIYLEASETQELEVVIDTFGLAEAAGEYTCVNCDGNPIGAASVELVDDNPVLVIVGDDDLLGATYRFEVEFCNPNGCANTFFEVVGRRVAEEYEIPAITLQSEERIELDVEASALPGPLACNKITDVPDEYEGRDKLLYFNNYSAPDSSFVYVASRYAGTDQVDITVCDSFTVCDVYHFTFIIQHDTLKLGGGGPETFLDDFSYDAIVPPATLWLDEDVYINRTFGEDQPSIGMATFDGLDRNGRPYRAEGFNDRLTSTYLDLTELSGDVYLTFWLQPKGLGQAPEEDDYLQLEFKQPDGEWEVIREFYAEDMNLDTNAAGFFFPIEIPGGFKHEAFQFRFSVYNSGNGIDDIWNLDYVWLSNEAATLETDITDVTLMRPPAALITPYTSMPWRHFSGREADYVIDEYFTYLFNLDNDQALNAGAGLLAVREASTGSTLAESNLLDACCRTVFSNDDIGYVQPLLSYSTILQGLEDPAFDGAGRLEFEVEYNLTDVTNEQSGPGYESVARNNRAINTTIFDDYFAYDDGSAENGVVVQEGDQVALRYTATEDDSLQAVQFHFPRINSNVSTQEFHLLVWVGELDDEPEIRMTFQQPFYPSSYYDTLQAFTTYPLFSNNGPTAVFIPAGDFYIGWEQVSNCDFLDCIPVGFDRNNPAGLEALFFNNNDEGWQPFPATFLPGALMLRPVMGSERPVSSGTARAAELDLGLQLYPNPAQDAVYLQVQGQQPGNLRMALLNSVGQCLHDSALAPQLPLNEFPDGLYILKVYDPQTQRSLHRRLIINK